MDVNEKDWDKLTALITAASAGHSDIVKLLIKKGADVNSSDKDGITVLMEASIMGHTKIVDLLIDAGAEIDFKSNSQVTALWLAAGENRIEVMKHLLKKGADASIARSDGITALMTASVAGHLDSVKLFLENDADPLAVDADDEERSPLLLAVKGNYGNVASALVEGGTNPNTPYIDDEGESHNLLLDSIIVENNDFANLLISKGADIYSEDDKRVTTLLQASYRGMVSVVKALLVKHSENGGKSKWVDSASDEGITMQIAASSEGHIDVAKLLIDAKADVNAKDKDQTNSLMAAAAQGHADIVELLLKAGAAVNEQNVDGHTALMFAYNGKNQVETLWERYTQFVKESEMVLIIQ